MGPFADWLQVDLVQGDSTKVSERQQIVHPFHDSHRVAPSPSSALIGSGTSISSLSLCLRDDNGFQYCQSLDIFGPWFVFLILPIYLPCCHQRPQKTPTQQPEPPSGLPPAGGCWGRHSTGLQAPQSQNHKSLPWKWPERFCGSASLFRAEFLHLGTLAILSWKLFCGGCVGRRMA